jgi:hypothetical protein
VQQRAQFHGDVVALVARQEAPVIASRWRRAGVPFAQQQALRLQPPQQRIQRPFLDRQAAVGEGLAERVTVLAFAQLAEHGQYQHAAPEFDQTNVPGLPGSHASPALFNAQYIATHTMSSTVRVAQGAQPRVRSANDRQ